MGAQPVSNLKFGTKPKTLGSYLMGLFLSLFFTIAAFGLVSMHILDKAELYISLAVLAFVQLITQVVCFLRLNTTPEGQWNTLPFIFTLIIVAVLAGGSFWIMYNLNVNMM